jgi:hypothetical protein
MCIAQDDDLDKAKEIKKMAEIYKNATITIAAASSPDVKCGFLEDGLFPMVPLPLALPDGGLGTRGLMMGSQLPQMNPWIVGAGHYKRRCCHQESCITAARI